MNRRTFLKSTGGGVAATVIGSSAVSTGSASANNRIGVAIMGVRGRGVSLTDSFSSMADVDLHYICDVDSSVVGPAFKIAEEKGKKPKLVEDVRRVLDDPAVDALVVATPIHWHAAATILACEASKDVYVEKPMSHNVREGRLMIEAARKHNRVVQVGSQSRSRPITHRLVEFLQSGELGEIKMTKAINAEMRPDLGHKPDEEVPDTVNYDLWTGPAPMLPFNRNHFHRTYSWHWNYGAAELGDNGAHWLDICRWVMGVDYPTRISGMGRQIGFDDDKQTPDTDLLAFDFGDKLMLWEERIWTPYTYQGSENTIEFYGTRGMAQMGRWVGGHYAHRIFDSKGQLVRYEQEDSGDGGALPHIRNFLDCVRSRKKPAADVELAHVSTTICHLGNIVCRTGRNITFDAATETVKDDPEANKYITREYRDHWSSKPFLRT